MENIPFENLTAVIVVNGIVVLMVRWILTQFSERMKAIESSLHEVAHAMAEVNDAVNHRHERDGENGGRKLYDIALENNSRISDVEKAFKELTEWKKSYDGGPLDDGKKVIEFVESVQHLMRAVQVQHAELKQYMTSIGCPRIVGNDDVASCEDVRKTTDRKDGGE